jgi:16S rRNA (cytosine967-C5)-methyltransferase
VQLQTELRKEEIETQTLEEYPDAILLKKRANVFSWGSFKDGMFEIQDAGSQLIGYFTGVLPGQTVVDACAGAGGKSLHLAALMNNKGRIISMDVSAWKLEELEKRAKRASVSIIKTQIIESEKTIAALKEKADVLLLDVPCSGVGVLKRNPDAKWKFSNEVFNKTKQLQQTILNDYALMVKPGGTLVYSTCSIFPSENRNQVDLFLQKNINFEIIKEKTVMPHEGFDGFYMCKILKKK